MNEPFLCWLWQYQAFDKKNLRTVKGLDVQVYCAGVKEAYSGPDFFASRLCLSGLQWVGAVEVHVRSSDWYRHKHDQDPAYANVILHVVYEMDRTVLTELGEELPCLELKGRFSERIYQSYLVMMTDFKRWIPCQQFLSRVREVVATQWMIRVGTERLENKVKELRQLSMYCKYGMEELFCRWLIKCAGTGINSLPFTWLSTILNFERLEYCQQQKEEPEATEALVFGQAGLLSARFQDPYVQRLQNRYTNLDKRRMGQLKGFVWKYAGTRPMNFPSLRLAQLCELLRRRKKLFSELMNSQYSALKQLIEGAEPSNYWLTHFLFDKPSPNSCKSIGREMAHHLIINSVPAFYLYYAREQGVDSYAKRAIELLESSSAESNSVIQKFSEYGLSAQNSLEAQGLIQLKKMYCDSKKCLNCAIGYEILRRDD